MRRDLGNEVIVAIAVVSVLAFALIFGIVLSLTGAPQSGNSLPTETISPVEDATSTTGFSGDGATASATRTLIAILPSPTPSATPTITDTPRDLNSEINAISTQVAAALSATAAVSLATAEVEQPTATDTRAVLRTDAPIIESPTVTRRAPNASNTPTEALESTNTRALPDTATRTGTDIHPATATSTVTLTPTARATSTTGATNTPRATSTPRSTSTPQSSNTSTNTATTANTSTPRPLNTFTATATTVVTNTPTRTNTSMPRATNTPTVTNTLTPRATSTATLTSTPRPTNSPAATNTAAATNTPAPTHTPFVVPTSLVLGTNLPPPTLIGGATPTLIPVTPMGSACSAPAGWVTFAVPQNTTLYTIARNVGSTVGELRLINCLGDFDNITPASTIYVPARPAAVATGIPVVPTLQGDETSVCAVEGVIISEPAAYSDISGVVVVRGTAAIPGFRSYRIEVRPAYSERYDFYLQRNEPLTIEDGELGILNSDLYEDGLHYIRLSVVANGGYQSCEIPVIFR